MGVRRRYRPRRPRADRHLPDADAGRDHRRRGVVLQPRTGRPRRHRDRSASGRSTCDPGRRSGVTSRRRRSRAGPTPTWPVRSAPSSACPVAFDTDVGAAALGEQRWGASPAVADLLLRHRRARGSGARSIVDGRRAARAAARRDGAPAHPARSRRRSVPRHAARSTATAGRASPAVRRWRHAGAVPARAARRPSGLGPRGRVTSPPGWPTSSWSCRPSGSSWAAASPSTRGCSSGSGPSWSAELGRLRGLPPLDEYLVPGPRRPRRRPRCPRPGPTRQLIGRPMARPRDAALYLLGKSKPYRIERRRPWP